MFTSAALAILLRNHGGHSLVSVLIMLDFIVTVRIKYGIWLQHFAVEEKEEKCLAAAFKTQARLAKESACTSRVAFI
jgi:hypothetical protein